RRACALSQSPRAASDPPGLLAYHQGLCPRGGGLRHHAPYAAPLIRAGIAGPRHGASRGAGAIRPRPHFDDPRLQADAPRAAGHGSLTIDKKRMAGDTYWLAILIGWRYLLAGDT